ncbi:MAG: response regulator [Bacteroidota bacterium]|jgi:CheY-like chemotaxis protein
MIQQTLIIDDDKLSIYLTKTILERTTDCKHFESANSCDEAINYIKYCIEKNENSLPDLILLDLDMPSGNGWVLVDFLKEIKSKIKKEINIFMLSSTFDKGNIIKSRNCDVISDFISKPLIREDVEFIKEAIEKKKIGEVYYK